MIYAVVIIGFIAVLGLCATIIQSVSDVRDQIIFQNERLDRLEAQLRPLTDLQQMRECISNTAAAAIATRVHVSAIGKRIGLTK